MPSISTLSLFCILASTIQLAQASAISLNPTIDTMLSARSQTTTSGGLSQDEKSTLYVVAGVGGILIILGLAIGILRSRHHKACKSQARGVTQSILKKIPIIQYDCQSTRKSSLDGSIDSLDEKSDFVEHTANHTCPICTEDFVQYQLLRVLPCGHQYHMKCIEDWLARGSNCPVW